MKLYSLLVYVDCCEEPDVCVPTTTLLYNK